MLNDFLWNMIGYIPKYPVNPSDDGIIPYEAERIFQLEPEPPAVGSLNEYILSALQDKNLMYFSFFLHHYEPQLNKRIKGFLGVDGGDPYDTDRKIKGRINTNKISLVLKDEKNKDTILVFNIQKSKDNCRLLILPEEIRNPHDWTLTDIYLSHINYIYGDDCIVLDDSIYLGQNFRTIIKKLK